MFPSNSESNPALLHASPLFYPISFISFKKIKDKKAKKLKKKVGYR